MRTIKTRPHALVRAVRLAGTPAGRYTLTLLACAVALACIVGSQA